MSKLKIITIIAIGLLATNLFWVWFFLSNKPPHLRRDAPKKVIIEQLQLDKQQSEAYEMLIQGHQENIQKLEQDIARLKNQLYLGLKSGEMTDAPDSVIAEIGKAQMSIEFVHFNHFKDIKNLCRPEQLKLFDEFTIQISKLFAPLPLRVKNEMH